MVVVMQDIKCPKCGSPELKSPTELNIRAYKVCDDRGVWWSQCLVCADTTVSPPKGGWFHD